MTRSYKKKVLSEEHKEKLRQIGFARKQTDATKEKCRLINLGKPKTEAHRKHLSESAKNRPPVSNETKEKLSKLRKDFYKNKDNIEAMARSIKLAHAKDPTIKQRMSAASKKKWQDPLYKQNLSYKHQSSWDNDAKRKQALVERNVGGFWYGSVPYYENPQYCEMWTPELRERVGAYFGYVCVECGTPQNGRQLAIHHVHYNKKTCCDGSPRDLVPLCAECHSATNHNREYWEQHFSDMLYNYYGGKSFFTKEEMKAYKNKN